MQKNTYVIVTLFDPPEMHHKQTTKKAEWCGHCDKEVEVVLLPER